MPTAGKRDRYHYGDLRSALIAAAIEIIGERGVRNFTMAEASRRLGVAASAPYAHFADRDDLLAAVAVRGYELLGAQLAQGAAESAQRSPADQLAAMARGYVRFAAAHRAVFDVLYEAGVDKTRHPELEAAERPVSAAFLDCVRGLCEGDDSLAEQLATAIEATAHGHAVLLLDTGAKDDAQAVEHAADLTARAVLALVEGRRLLYPTQRADRDA
jgi:AcrR family transcriptional regulator